MTSARRFGSSRVVRLLALAATVAFVACDKHPSRPLLPTLNGRVLDAVGRPVSQARIAFFYRIEAATGTRPDTCGDVGTPGRLFSVYPNPAPSPAVNVVVSFPNDSRTKVAIYDRAGTLVRTIADRSFVAGSYHLVWDGTSDDGSAAPNGIYVVRWTDTENDSVFSRCRRVLLNIVDMNDQVGRYVAVTDGDGKFSVPLAGLPIRDGGLGFDSLGNFTETFAISTVLDVCAAENPKPSAPMACVVQVPLGDLSKSVSVTVRLP